MKIAFCKSFVSGLLFIGISVHVAAKDPSEKLNGYKNGKYHGRWIIYSDSSHTKIESEGRYKNGKEIGTWRFYHENGNLRRRERYCSSRIRTTHYYESGVKKSSGKALLRYEGEYLHYFYQGKWKYFNPDGTLNEIIKYENGQEVSGN